MIIKRLGSGGLITNYHCTSRCKHCLYNSGPLRPKDFMDKEVASQAASICVAHGCRAIHIGGGEPFLDFLDLKAVITEVLSRGVHVQYVETNASWCVSEKRTCLILEELLTLGVNTLLVSISPFHLEYIPLKRVLLLLKACEKVGMGTFPWTVDFLDEFSSLDPDRCYTIEELNEIFWLGYVQGIASRYWIHPGGRALNMFFGSGYALSELLDMHPNGCEELVDTSHFHIDLYGNYIPGLCAGLSIKMCDLGRPITEDAYPLITLLFNEGINGLYELALFHGFQAKQKSYGSKCTLCHEIRQFLTGLCRFEKELSPKSFYTD